MVRSPARSFFTARFDSASRNSDARSVSVAGLLNFCSLLTFRFDCEDSKIDNTRNSRIYRGCEDRSWKAVAALIKICAALLALVYFLFSLHTNLVRIKLPFLSEIPCFIIEENTLEAGPAK